MPLNATTLSAGIYAAIVADVNNGFSSSYATDAVQQANVKALCDAIATAVVAHITSSALVTVTGVQAGAGTAPGVVT